MYYFEEIANKKHAVDSIDHAFAEILQYMLAKQTVKSKKYIEKLETIFEIGGEGGSIKIERRKSDSKEVFIYKHNEFDPTDQGLDVNKRFEFDSFEEPFEMINSKYPWPQLYIMTIHKDYRNYIIAKLVEKLNENMVSLEVFGFHKQEVEEKFDIELIYSVNENKEPNWNFKTIV
ncbi:MAG: hypothetical protein PHW82_06485 [Bacteroidales bacterium]|nr:hypothetical protein [Bacteroidales bacterium]